MTQNQNGVVLRTVEGPAISELEKTDGRNMLWWDATVTPRAAPLAHWAATIVISFGTWDANAANGHGAQLGTTGSMTPAPDFTGARSIGSLSEDGAIRLAAVTGMSSSVAATVSTVREARLGPGGRFNNWGHVVDLIMNTPRTGGRLTSTSAETTLAELDRIKDQGRLVPYFGFDPDADLAQWLEYLRHV